jgi:hypothetical protein
VSKIVLTQIFVLLGTINQEKDKAKREGQADQISNVRPTPQLRARAAGVKVHL